VALPLTKLLRTDNKFALSKEREASFQELKRHLLSNPMLTIPKGNQGLVVYSDASM